MTWAKTGVPPVQSATWSQKKPCLHFWAKLQPNCPRSLRSRSWLQNQDFGASVGALDVVFRDTSFPISPRSQNRLLRKNVPGAQGRRNCRGKKCSHFWGPKAHQIVPKCFGTELGSETKILEHPLERSACFFEIIPFRVAMNLEMQNLVAYPRAITYGYPY